MDEPEIRELYFAFGVLTGYGKYGFLYGTPENSSSLPMLVNFGDKGKSSVVSQFLKRRARWAIFCHDGYKAELKEMLEDIPIDFMHERSHREKMPIAQWLEGVALYYDYLAAMDSENAAVNNGEEKRYFILLDRRDINQRLIDRRLIYELRTLSAAQYFLRQHSLLQQEKWSRENFSVMHWKSVFTKYFSILSSRMDADKVCLGIETSFPYAKEKRPYVQNWIWRISYISPKKEELASYEDHAHPDDERWNFRPGDPKLLRETGSGLYGSYPMFEGDDEPEFRDES